MSLIDFNQEVQDQGCLHVAVAALDEVHSSLYTAVYDRLCSLPPVQLSGTVIFLRFLKAENLPPWAGKGPRWNDFSAHKKIVGLLGVAQCSDADDLDKAKDSLKSASAVHKPNLCEARCVVYGPKKMLESGEGGAGLCVINCPVEQEIYSLDDICASDLEEVVRGFVQDICNKLTTRINMLEKMLNQTGRSESLLQLKSPFESREVGTQEDDTSDIRYVCCVCVCTCAVTYTHLTLPTIYSV